MRSPLTKEKKAEPPAVGFEPLAVGFEPYAKPLAKAEPSAVGFEDGTITTPRAIASGIT